MGYLYVKNWARFQHRPIRRPAWTKSFVSRLRDRDLQELPEIQQFYLERIWAIAARNMGAIPDDPAEVKRLGSFKRKPDLDLMVERGFLERTPSKELEALWKRIREEEEKEPNAPTKKAPTRNGNGKARVRKPKTDIPVQKRADEVRLAWNAAAERRGWAPCSRRPGGNVKRLLEARVKEEHWWETYQEALQRLVEKATWYERGKLETFVRPDTTRKILDGEWDSKDDKHEGRSKIDRKTLAEFGITED